MAIFATFNSRASQESTFMQHSGTDPLKQAAAALTAHSGNVQKTLENVAAAALVPLRQAREEGTLAQKTADIPAVLGFVMGQIDFDDLTNAVHTVLSRENLAQHFNTSATDEGTKKDLMLKRAQALKEQIESMSEEQHTAFSAAIESILPPGLAASVLAMREGQTLQDDVREVRGLVKNLTADHIAEAMMARETRTNREGIIAAISDTAAGITSEQTRKFLLYSLENFGGSDIATLYKRTWEAAEEILAAAQKGDFLSPQNPRKVKAFAQSLEHALSVIEEGLGHAGIVLPQTLRDAAADYFDCNRLLRQAEGIRQAELARTGTQNDVAVGAPINVRRRTKGGPAR